MLWRAAVAGAAAAVVGLALPADERPGERPRGWPGEPPGAGHLQGGGDILDKAAGQAEQSPELNPDPGQFLQVETATADVFVFKQQPYLHRTERTSWESVDGTRDGAVTTKVAEPQALPGRSVPEGAAEMIGGVKWHTLPVCADRPEVLRTDYAHLSKLRTDAKGMLDVLRERWRPATTAGPTSSARTKTGRRSVSSPLWPIPICRRRSGPRCSGRRNSSPA